MRLAGAGHATLQGLAQRPAATAALRRTRRAPTAARRPRRPPPAPLPQLLEQRDAAKLEVFFKSYGPAEAAAMCILLATAGPPQVGRTGWWDRCLCRSWP